MKMEEIDFNGGIILGIQEEDGKIYMGVRQACVDIGLTTDQARRQINNLKIDLVLKTGVKNLSVKFDTQVRVVQAIELDYVPLWLAKISITPKMKEESPEVVQRLIDYQLRAKDVLADAFISKEGSYSDIIGDILSRSLEDIREDNMKASMFVERRIDVLTEEIRHLAKDNHELREVIFGLYKNTSTMFSKVVTEFAIKFHPDKADSAYRFNLFYGMLDKLTGYHIPERKTFLKNTNEVEKWS